MADVVLKQVSKTYDNKQAYVVKDVSLATENEEFLVLVGPSGCGKTTTLRMIAGLADISQGEIYIDGKLVNDLEAKDRDIAMVFQNYALYPHLTVFQNIAYPLKQRKFLQTSHAENGKNIKNGKSVYKKLSKAEIQTKVEDTAKILNLQHLLNRKPKQLSGGERQRVALARAMVRQPKLFLMDEPLSNLDAQLRTETRGEILKLHQALKTTFVYVTHDQTEAMTMGDRIVVMNKGVIQQMATPYEIYHQPANLFVAKFIGSPPMNCFPGRIQMVADKIEVKLSFATAEITMPLPDYPLLREKITDGSLVTVGVRPEHLRLGTEQEPSIVVDITQKELMGADIVLYGEAGEDSLVCRMPESKEAYQLKKAAFTFSPQHLHLFSAETQDNLLI